MLFVSVLSAAMVLGMSSAAPMQLSSCSNPNGTDTKEHWWQCPSSGAVTIKSMKPTIADGTYEYPINIKQKLHLHNTITNNAKVYSSLRIDVALWTWGGIFGCKWHSFPLFGMGSNVDPCAVGTHCPIPMGDSDYTNVIDFSQGSFAFTNNIPYKLEIKLKDHSDGDKVIACSMMEAIYIKK